METFKVFSLLSKNQILLFWTFCWVQSGRFCDQRGISLFYQRKDFIELHLAIDVTFLVSSSKHLRYHPMIIKFCSAIIAKSPTACEEIWLNQQKGSGILILPIQRTLRDYRNYIRPQRGDKNSGNLLCYILFKLFIVQSMLLHILFERNFKIW